MVCEFFCFRREAESNRLIESIVLMSHKLPASRAKSIIIAFVEDYSILCQLHSQGRAILEVADGCRGLHPTKLSNLLEKPDIPFEIRKKVRYTDRRLLLFFLRF